MEALETKLGLESGTLKPKRLLLERAYVQLDGFTVENNIVCEAYAHIGKLKPAQTCKVINDAMKMLLIKKIAGIQLDIPKRRSRSSGKNRATIPETAEPPIRLTEPNTMFKLH